MDKTNNSISVLSRFFGRTKTRSLSVSRQNIMDSVLCQYGFKMFGDIDYDNRSCIDLEIGFGDGTHLAQMAINYSDRLFIGAEPFVNGVASLAQKISDNNIKNIRIYNGNTHILLDQIPDSLINVVYILFPDPWPKKKHHFRRFINEKTLKDIHRVLEKQGMIRIATDHADYCCWILEHLLKCQNILFDVQIQDSRPPIDEWPITKYEQKAVTPITYIICRKL